MFDCNIWYISLCFFTLSVLCEVSAMLGLSDLPADIIRQVIGMELESIDDMQIVKILTFLVFSPS